MANVLVRGVDRGGGVGWDGVVWWTGDVGHGSWFDPLRFNRYHDVIDFKGGPLKVVPY